MGRYRHEYKYLLDCQTEQILRIRAAGILALDSHVQKDGSYFIRSLYFDDCYDSCLQENEAGYDPRSKFRIRYYNHDTSRIHLEKKRKTRGMTWKDSCDLTYEECCMLMQGIYPDIDDSMSTMKKQLLLEMRMRNLMPKVIVSYERIPYVYSGGNVRITFDKDISSSGQISEFLTGKYQVRPILSLGHSILEVKWDEIIPLHIKDVMQFNKLQWMAFSKYSMCRKFHL